MPSHAPDDGRQHDVFDCLCNWYHSTPSLITTAAGPFPPAALAAVPRPASADAPRPADRRGGGPPVPPVEATADPTPAVATVTAKPPPIKFLAVAINYNGSNPYTVPAFVPAVAVGAGISATDPLHLVAGNVLHRIPGREAPTRGRSAVYNTSQPPTLCDRSELSTRPSGPDRPVSRPLLPLNARRSSPKRAPSTC